MKRHIRIIDPDGLYIPPRPEIVEEEEVLSPPAPAVTTVGGLIDAFFAPQEDIHLGLLQGPRFAASELELREVRGPGYVRVCLVGKMRIHETQGSREAVNSEIIRFHPLGYWGRVTHLGYFRGPGGPLLIWVPLSGGGRILEGGEDAQFNPGTLTARLDLI
jgi:hypothetical protein